MNQHEAQEVAFPRSSTVSPGRVVDEGLSDCRTWTVNLVNSVTPWEALTAGEVSRVDDRNPCLPCRSRMNVEQTRACSVMAKSDVHSNPNVSC